MNAAHVSCPVPPTAASVLKTWRKCGAFTSVGVVAQEAEALPAPSLMQQHGRLVAHALSELPDASLAVFDRDLRFALVRGEALSDNGMNPEDFEGRLASEALAPERWALHEPTYRGALQGETTVRDVTSPDGTREYLLRCRPVIAAGEVIGGVMIATEITQLRAAQRLALESERRFSLAMRAAPIGMAVVSLTRTFVEVNEALCAMLDAEPVDLIGESLDVVIHHADQAGDVANRERVLAGEEESITTEKRLRSLSGSEVWVQHSIGLVRDEDDRPVHFVSQFVDVTEARRARRELERLAAHDPLTDLKNRAAFEQAVSEWSEGAALLFIDIDGFKAVNDQLGHASGDRVLSIVAKRLAGRLRNSDLLARFGGDEFVVAIRGADTERARVVASHFHDAMRTPVDLEGSTVTVGLSIGVAAQAPDESFGEVLRRADQAMYVAKQAGGARSRFAD